MSSNLFSIADMLAVKSNAVSKMSKKAVSFMAVTVLGLSAMSAITASAQTTNRGLVINNAIQELDAEKNQTYTLSINLENDSQEDNVTLTPKLYSFDSVKEDGTPNIKELDATAPESSWITFADSQIVLNKNEKKESKVAVSVPDSAAPGGHYFALTYSQASNTSSQGQQVAINKEIAALLFLNVKGDVERNVELADVKLSSNTIDPMFDGFTMSYKVNLTGNTYYKPSGNIFTGSDLTNPENNLVVNPNQRIILPNTSKTFAVAVKPMFGDSTPAVQANDVVVAEKFNRPLFGKQNVNFKMIYVNKEGKLDQKVAEASVWFVPWRLILGVAVVLVLAIGAFIVIKNKKSDKAEK